MKKQIPFFPVIILLFLLSGISGLIYEIVWSRFLIYTFGATLYAVVTVLCSFMGGLALGSYLFGKWSDRVKNPLKLYGILQIGIAVFGWLVPVIIKRLTPVFGVIFAAVSDSFFIQSLIRFGIVFAILIIPTTMMGATLPALSKFVIRRQSAVGEGTGLLYAFNTFGAVLGCFLTGFYLIAAFGIQGTVMTAVVINFIVGVVALVLSVRLQDDYTEFKSSLDQTVTQSAQPAATVSYPRNIVLLAVIVFGISGFLSLSYQVFWTRSLIFNFQNLQSTTYAFTSMLTVFLVGLALGSYIATTFIDQQEDPLRLFGLIQILIGLSVFVSLFLIFNWTRDFFILSEFTQAGDLKWTAAVFNVLARSALAMLLPTLMMGMTFPVICKIAVGKLESLGATIGSVYAVNTLGSILGAFLTGFFVIPVLGVAYGIVIFSMINLAMGIILIVINPRNTVREKAVLAALGIGMLGLIVVKFPNRHQFQPLLPEEELLFYEEGPLATVSVVETILDNRVINVDNLGVAGTERDFSSPIKKSLTHVPMLVLKDPKSILTVGFGSGGASYSFTTYDCLEQIHCVEIEETVLHAAPFLEASNHGVLTFKGDSYRPKDERLKIIIDDVRSYLKLSSTVYDIIATDCTDLRYKSNASLYDREYFNLCKEKITDDGTVLVWMPLGGLTNTTFRSALGTFYDVFPNMYIWYMNNDATHYVLLMGTKNPLAIDFDLMCKRLAAPKVKTDLEELDLDNPYKILSCYMTSGKKLEGFLKSARLNTQNRPFLEFECPKSIPPLNQMNYEINLMYENRDDVLNYVTGMSEDDKKRLKRYTDALPYLIAGQNAYRIALISAKCEPLEPNFREAAVNYYFAVQANPEDTSAKYLADFSGLAKRSNVFAQERFLKIWMAEIYLIQKRYDEALSFVNEFLTPDDTPDTEATRALKARSHAYAYRIAAEIYRKKGEKDNALASIDKGLGYKPDDAQLQQLRKEMQALTGLQTP